MLHKVSFAFTAEGAIIELLAFANGIPIKTWRADGKIVGGFTDAMAHEGTVLVITFKLFGLNGTNYKISCQFQDNGKAEDGSRPNPIEGQIVQDLKAEEINSYNV